MPVTRFRSLVEEAATEDFTELYLTGGEPFLHPDIVLLRAMMPLAGARDLRADAAFLLVSRDIGLTTAALVCAALLPSPRRRSLASTVGLCMLALAVLAPVLYPWCLLWGSTPLTLVDERYRSLLPTMTSAEPLPALPGLRWNAVSDIAVGAAAALVGVAALVGAVRPRNRPGARPTFFPALPVDEVDRKCMLTVRGDERYGPRMGAAQRSLPPRHLHHPGRASARRR